MLDEQVSAAGAVIAGGGGAAAVLAGVAAAAGVADPQNAHVLHWHLGQCDDLDLTLQNFCLFS